MIKYKKIYFDYFKIGMDDRLLCEVCHSPANDIHHIYPKKMGGSKTKDYIENLMAVCMDCHAAAHNEKISKEKLMEIHLKRL